MFKVAILALVIALSGFSSPLSGSPLKIGTGSSTLFVDGGQSYNTGNGGG